MVLAPGELHLWRAALDFGTEQEQPLTALLAPDELARIDHIIAPGKRRQHACAMGLLRLVLGHCLDADPVSLAFEYEPRGKPRLAGAHADRLQFNLSHSGGWILIAAALEYPVGIDVERIKATRGHDAIARRFFSPAECAALESFPESRRAEAFYRCWTAKEAVLKATGAGLSFPLDQCEILADPDGRIEVAALQGCEEASKVWAVLSCDPAAGYIGSCAVLGHPGLVHAWEAAPLLSSPD